MFSLKKVLTILIILCLCASAHSVHADTPPEGWPESFTVNGHVLHYQNGYGGSYQGADSHDAILLIQQYGRDLIDTPVDANLWFLERDDAGFTLQLQFLQGNPVAGFTDCLSKSFSYYPWGAPVAGPDYSYDPPILNLPGLELDLRQAGANVEGRYYPFNYPAAEQSCVVDHNPPIISDVTLGTSTESSQDISWQTNEQASSSIVFGTASGIYVDSLGTSVFETSHLFSLTHLMPNTTYYFKIFGEDSSGNISSTTESSFTTPAHVEIIEHNSRQNIHHSGSRHDISQIQSSSTFFSTSVSSSTKSNYSNPIFLRDLKIGMIGDDVLSLQKLLNSNGYLVASSGAGSLGLETRLFGMKTKLALIKFQIDHQINPASGYFGNKTRTLLINPH